ncbi:MAG: penicillin-binding protein 2 [Gammaproteobacteria bacterium]|nr:penicillin-binding protein 2 [Gammaproteobacteria bacterium]
MKFTRVQNYWNRQGLIKYSFFVIIGIFVYQAISIHSEELENISLQQKAISKSEKILTQKASRGNILDRNGSILAISLIQQKINLDPTLIQNEFIPMLAETLQLPFAELDNKIKKKRQANSGRKQLIIKENLSLTDPIIANLRKLKKQKLKVCKPEMTVPSKTLLERAKKLVGIEIDTKDEIEVLRCKDERISGVALQSSTFRYYPKAESISPLLGRTNNENIGAFGIEAEYDYLLAGSDGRAKITTNKQSSNIYYQAEVSQVLKQGEDIQLTIDADVQFHVFNAIKKSAEFHLADSASAIVLSANGEILALANYPAADPNDHQSYNPQDYRNRVLADKIEPGSTMKPFTMLLALEKGVISATDDELIDVSKSIGHVKTNAEVRKYGDAITVKKILEKSHNLGTVNIMERLEAQDVYEAWQLLGFGEYQGLMPSIENPGVLRHYSTWGVADKRTIAYGHGPMNTNLAQLAKAYLVFANEGSLANLKLIMNDEVAEENTQIFSANATNRIKEILDTVASMEGSGYRSIINGYEIGGKTGTAEMVIDGKYDKDIKRTYFVGFSPVEKPKYIMAVRLDYPKQCFTLWDPDLGVRCQGSNSAAMAFKDAMEKILNADASIQPTSAN